MKGVDDPVTQADINAQKSINATLSLHFPGIWICGEEEVKFEESDIIQGVNIDLIPANLLPEDIRQIDLEEITIWVDPLDGTKNFVKGDVLGVTSIIGICRAGRPILGIIHHPFDEAKPTYYGGPGFPIRKTCNAYQEIGEEVEK